MQINLAPLTAAARGVALWLGTTVVLVAGLTAAGIMRPAFPNEGPVVAVGFLLGALVGGAAVWKGEPHKVALAWTGIDLILAGCAMFLAVPLGLAA